MSPWGKLSLLLSGCSLIIAAGTRFILGGWITISYIFLALFVVGLLAALILDYKLYLEILTAKTTKNSMSLGWSLLLVIIGISAAGYFGHRFNRTFDLTEEKINSLSPQTEEALESLKEDLILYIFYKGDKISERGLFTKEELKNSLILYKQKTTKFKVRFVDTYKDNALAEKFNLSDLPDKNQKEIFVFAEHEGRSVRITAPFNEQSITSALVKVKKRTTKEIYFLVGHGEKDLQDDRPDGLKIFQQGLMDSGLTLKEWSFVQDGAPAKDPEVVLAIGSRRPWLDEETQWLKDYLKRGGRILIALDPGEKHNLQPFLKEFGINYQDNFILTPQGAFFGSAATALGAHFDSNHPITRRLTALKNVPAIFNRASVVEAVDEFPEEWTTSRLVRTVDASFAVPELKEKVKIENLNSQTVAIEVKPKSEKKKESPLSDPHGGHGESESEEEDSETSNEKENPQKKKEFRLVVFGDSDFLTNRYIHEGVNRDLALNTVVSLVDEEDLITIRPKQAKGTKISLTKNHRISLVTMVIILPLIFLSLSLWMWYRRREA
ncbi:MAG: Gldg family protein [Bdellovibrionales bacterium]|nr:Gldg family protein [Bdellovibrionales bacterium]